jgi:hypothetical protein
MNLPTSKRFAIVRMIVGTAVEVVLCVAAIAAVLWFCIYMSGQAKAQDLPPQPPVLDVVVEGVTVWAYEPPTPPIVPWNYQNYPFANEPRQVIDLVITRNRQQPVNRTHLNSAELTSPPPAETDPDTGGRVMDFGRSPDLDCWNENSNRQDCLKARGAANTVIREKWSGEDEYTLVTFPCTARKLRLYVEDGRVSLARLDEDNGTDCVYINPWTLCYNPECPHYMTCDFPFCAPNVPCEVCGVPGYDSSATDFGLYQSISADNAFAALPPITPQQMLTSAGTPPASVWLMQVQQVSDDTYSPPWRGSPNSLGPHETYPTYTDGLYFVLVSDLRIRAGQFGTQASFRIRKWQMWDFSTAGMFAFLGDWCAGSAHAGMVDGAGGVEATDIFAFLAGWFAGQ